MDTIVDDLGRSLARRIRSERLARNWSPAELARRAGVSRAMIDKIENGRSSPTAALLGRLSGALGLTMSALLARAESAAQGLLVRREDQSVWRDPGAGYLRRQVFPAPGSTLPLEVVHVDLPAGARVAFPASTFTFIRQLVWVLSGELVFVEGDEPRHLRAGDGLEVGPPRDCRFENRTDALCSYVVIVLRAGHDQRLDPECRFDRAGRTGQ